MQTPKGFISDDLLEVIRDEEMAKIMSQAKSPEECYDIVKDKIDVTLEEFTEQMTIINTYYEEKKSGLLSEEDLDAIAGGKTSHQKNMALLGGGMGGITATFFALSAAAS